MADSETREAEDIGMTEFEPPPPEEGYSFPFSRRKDSLEPKEDAAKPTPYPKVLMIIIVVMCVFLLVLLAALVVVVVLYLDAQDVVREVPTSTRMTTTEADHDTSRGTSTATAKTTTSSTRPSSTVTETRSTPGGMTGIATTEVSLPEISPDEPFPLTVPAGDFDYFTMDLVGDSDVELAFEDAGSDVTVAVYGRLGEKPTHVEYDVVKTLVSERSRKRAIVNDRIKIEFENLLAGHWVFGIFNGDEEGLDTTMEIAQSPSPIRCPLDCSGRGQCDEGMCSCIEGWRGIDCGQVAPVPCSPEDCSGHGYFRDNMCNCYDGWKGDKCQLADCIPSDCNGNGQCVDAVCQCHQGWTGTTCERVDCIPSDCNGNGHCVNGECRCYQGWQGQVCTTPYRPCPSDCSRHGNCNNVTGLCTCYGDWTEPDCSELSCEESCSGLGICYNGTCDCYSGWTGPLCRDRECIGGCGDNGICHNGTCTCNRGWSGSACQTNACPNSCHGNGDCVLISEVWQCVCHRHFRGVACSIGIESTCDDGIDNDKDTLIDCDDPDCCNTTDCVNDVSCMFSPAPEDFVKTNVSATQNFYDQVAFLFLDSGIQQDAEVDFLREDLVSVLRGSVTSRDSSPLQGVTISVHGFPQYGYTMTRQDGGYEIAVNGGGVLTINFNRKNFIGAQRSIQISVNQYVAVEGVVLLAVDQKVTVIDLESDEIQVAEGSVVEDAAGKRKGVIMFHPGTEATIVSNNGTDNETVYQPHIRVTEYTVGESGEEAMPAVLPPFTGYTYAMELSMDEASVNGTTDVFFNQTVYYYVENYLGFPVGSAVPTGYYNRTLGEWVASVNGLVIEILPPSDADSLSAGVDVTGGKVNATEEELLNLGFNDQELLKLNALYAPGETLWRVPIPHFTPWDCNWPYGPPDCGCTPGECDPGKPPPKDDCEEGSTTPPKEPPPPPDPCGGGGGPGDGGPGDGGPGDGGPGDGGPGDGGPGDGGPGDGDGEGDSGSDGGGDSSPPSDSPPEVPRIPDIPSVPNVPPVPGVPPSPGSPPSPGVPLPSRPIVIPTQQWVSHFPSIPITVNPGHFGPNLPVTPIVNDTESDDDLRTKRSDETLQPGGSFKVPDLSRNPGSMAVSIPGTALQLVYNHNRQAGYKSLIKVPLTGNTVPDIMENVIMEVTVAGKKVTRDVKPGLHVTESVAWDGKDGYSRTVKGGAKAKVKIGYKYQMVYYPVRSEFTRSFNRFSQANTRAQVARGDRSVVYWEERELDVVRGIAGGGLGGWSLSIHHSYDANSGTLHMGSGETLRYTDQSAVLETVAGSDSRAAIDCRTCGEGLGKETRLRLPVALATSPDGSVYFGDYNFIRRIWPNGTVSTVLQLLQTRPKQTYYLATSRRDGTLYMSDSARRQVLRIDPDTGEETVLAGTGERCAPWEDGCGDGGLATKAKLTVPKGIAVGKDGDIFLVDNRRIRQIGNDGVIEAHIGTNVIGQSSAERSRDLYDAPMKEISFTWPTDIAVHPEEDTLYIVDGDVIFKLSRQGRVRPVIGRSPVRGPTFPATDDVNADNALNTKLLSPRGIAVSASGDVYISETDYHYVNRIRLVAEGGGISLFAGQRSDCDCAQSNCDCFHEALALSSKLYVPTAVALSSTRALYVADEGNYRIRSIKVKLPSSAGSGRYVIPGPNPSNVFIFSRLGQHLRTLDLKNNRLLYEFHYNDDDELHAISDHFNNTVSIERMSDGSPHAIEAANGVRTVLGMNSEGMLDFVSDSEIGNTRFAYQDGGLLRGVTTPQGYQQYLAYDENGRVFAHYDNLGRRELYGNFQGLTSSSRVKYSSMNRKQVIETQTLSGQLKQTYKTSYGVSQEILSNYADGSTVTTSADGTKTLKTKSPHPLWGSQISLAASTVTTLPSGLTKRLEIDHFATQSDPNDPLTVLTIGKHIKVNGETITTSEYSHNDRTSTILLGSDVERRTVYDGDGREVRIQRPSVGLLDIVYEYDPTSDQYSKRAQGNLWQQYTYDIYGNVISELKSSGLETKYEYMDQKLLSKIILPSGRSYDFRYDDVGNLASIGMPSGSEHFLRTRIRPRERDEIYRAPLSLHSTFMSTYNLDGDLMQTLYPVVGDMSHWYDELQRPTGVSFNDAFLEFVYKDNSERVMRLNRYSKGVLESATTYVYDGFIPVAATLFELAEIVADFKYSYNDAFLVSKLVSVVFGRTFVTDISYDKFGEITKYGPFDAREPSPNVRTLSDSQISCGYTHDQYGRLVETSCTVQGSQKFKYTLQYNNDSLISDRSVEIGDSDSYINNYQYDIDGQLVDVITDGKPSEHYVYDVNGNRVQWGGVGAEPTHSAIYDENDRIVQHDLLQYDFSDDGFLQGKGGATFQYNARGELEKAYKPDFYDMTYTYDGLGRRILSLDEVTGESVRYFYGDPNNALRVTHVVRGEEEIVTALYYNQLGHLFAMKTDGVINYVMCDHLGTPLVVLNSIGDVLKVIKRDSYGVVIMDSNPEIFVPLGFAGGIYDDRTKLTRFHYRDYDATIGRWTSRDPSLYSSQQPNLYQYVFNDPINLRDPLGLLCIGFGYYNGWGGGAELCFDHTGWSGCVEGGAGVGGFSHELNSGGPKKGFRAGVFAEGSINIPGVMSHSVGGSYEVIDPIDWDEGKINPCLKTDWDVNYKRSYGPTGVKCGTSGCEVSTALKPPKVDKIPKIGVEGKIGAKVCYGR